jgi:hypothetical protein
MKKPDIAAILTRTVLAEVMTLDEKHDCGIELFMPVYNTQEISWISLCENLHNHEISRT